MINGIGGVFIFSENPEALANWYSKTLGINFESVENGNTHYTVFWSRDDKHTERRFDTTFAIMKSKVNFPEHQNNLKEKDMYGDRKFMLNLRVDDMQQLLIQLRSLKINVLDEVDEGYGCTRDTWKCRFQQVKKHPYSRLESAVLVFLNPAFITKKMDAYWLALREFRWKPSPSLSLL